MKSEGILEKVEIYILSLWFLFLLIILVTTNIDLCFEAGCKFIGLKELFKSNVVPFIAFTFLVIGTFSYFRLNAKMAGSVSLPEKIKSIEDYNYEHLTFLTTYIIPLICFNLESWRYVTALGILLIVIGIIYVKTDKFYANPTLAILGYKLYKVEIAQKNGGNSTAIIMTTDELVAGNYITTRKLDSKLTLGKRHG